MPRQDVNYTNPRVGKNAITLGQIVKAGSYLTGLAALAGLTINGFNMDTNSINPNYLKEILENLSAHYNGLFYTSVIAHLSGGAIHGFGKWTNWRANG